MNDPLRDALVDGIPAFERSRRRRIRILVPGFVAVVVGAVVVLAVTRPLGDERFVATGPAVVAPTPEATPERTPPPVPTVAAVPPVADVVDLVAAGEAHPLGDGVVVFWSAFDQFAGSAQFQGVALDTGSGVLTALEVPADVGLNDRAVGAGNGELLVCCANGVAKLWSAADGWRTFDAPFEGSAYGVWTHSDFVVMVPGSGVAFLDSTRDNWSPVDVPLPDELATVSRVEVEWTSRPGNPVGEALYVWPSPPARTSHRGWALDPGLEPRWRELPVIPEETAPAFVDMIDAGGTIVVGGGLPAAEVGSERFVLWVLAAGVEEWVRVDLDAGEPSPCECNLGSQTMLWTGSELFVHLGALGSGIDADGALFSVTDLAATRTATLVARGADALRPLTVVDGDVLWARSDGAVLLGDEVVVD